MSNLANYSPYNKTFKFLLFQNQAYHERNKITAKPCVKTNLRYVRPSTSPFEKNPEQPLGMSDSQGKPPTRSTQRCESADPSMARSMMFSSGSLRSSSVIFEKPKRVVHKNQSFDKFRNRKIERDNVELVKRLIDTNCEVIRNKKSSDSFKKHLKYREIRNKYSEDGVRKHPLALGNSSLLCPTLKQFNQSEAGSKFYQLDMSWISGSRSPSPRSSLRHSLRKRNSNIS